jgi:enterochelin esterase-like enzyme
MIALLAGALLATHAGAWASESLQVELPPTFVGDASGRLLVFARRLMPGREQPESVDASAMAPGGVEVAGQDLTSFGSERRIGIDLDSDATTPFSRLPAGNYQLQVVLDKNGDYGRNGRGAGDVLSKVSTMHLPLAPGSSVVFDHVIRQSDPWHPPGASAKDRERLTAARPNIVDFGVDSRTLGNHFGRRVRLQSWVPLPTTYSSSPSKSWPVVYFLGAGSSNYVQNLAMAGIVAEMTKASNVPQLIWVFLDYSTPAGTTEFVDSQNNGPWETALMQELIPAIEKRFRTQTRQSGRFLTGHSSGGWASLWLQIRHPEFFAGAWATAPDPVDFHNFVGVNLYAPGANMYWDTSGHPRPQVRSHGKVLATIRDVVRLEEVLGHVGGTFQSFDWVFSPRAADGSAMQLFDRVSGVVDPAVASYWAAHFDISRRIGNLSDAERRSLAGKLHVIVGDEETFYLDGAVKRLRATLQLAGIPAAVNIVSGKNHNDLYGTREDPTALLRTIAEEMYDVARGGSAPSRK